MSRTRRQGPTSSETLGLLEQSFMNVTEKVLATGIDPALEDLIQRQPIPWDPADWPWWNWALLGCSNNKAGTCFSRGSFRYRLFSCTVGVVPRVPVRYMHLHGDNVCDQVTAVVLETLLGQPGRRPCRTHTHRPKPPPAAGTQPLLFVLP